VRAVSGTFLCPELQKTPLMISARLHGYAVKSVFQGLVHAVLETSAFGTLQIITNSHLFRLKILVPIHLCPIATMIADVDQV